MYQRRGRRRFYARPNTFARDPTALEPTIREPTIREPTIRESTALEPTTVSQPPKPVVRART